MLPVSPEVNFPELEREIIQFWSKNNIFEKSIKLRENSKRYTFYDGPPFATGTPHYGHLLAGTIKDIIPRYYTMKGYFVERRFGWDCHGLPIEMLVEEELGLKGPVDVRKFGVDRFNEACRDSVLRYEKEWRRTTERLGRWVDFDNGYKTMDPTFMESVWWVFKQLWDKGLIFKGKRVMAYSWRLGTPLSNFEAGLNYKNVEDPSIIVKFFSPELDAYFLVWTTTPWTLPANVALAVNPSFEYYLIESNSERFIILDNKASELIRNGRQVAKFKGSDLHGKKYVPLFDFGKSNNPYICVTADFVQGDVGTGIVHIAPCYGDDDFELSKKFDLPVVDLLDEEGNFTDSFPLCSGKNFKESDPVIISFLKERGLLFSRNVIHHQYPFCYRSDTPLIYRAIDAWYVKVEEFRDQLLNANSKIYWVPEYVKEGRFGNWLAQARDWNISRNRFWGNPIPVWECKSCENRVAVGSRDELFKLSGVKIEDLHIHFVDKITFKCLECGEMMERVKEVLDCWFESGSMPFAQNHYPFEKSEIFNQMYPADFIAEGMDQTRGWFYTLLVIGTHLTGQAPYKNVVVNGIVLAEDGKKMSKRLKNYPDPNYILETYGADALRIYMINSPVVRGDNLRFSELGVKETVRTILLPIWNAYSFFVNYSLIDKYIPNKLEWGGSKNKLDSWIVSRLQSLLLNVEKEMGEYRLYKVFPSILEFIEDLTNFYIRRNRRRFWESEGQDKEEGYNTLFFCLFNLAKVIAPFAPFISENMYQNFRRLLPNLPESIHLCDYPVANPELIDTNLEKEIDLIKKVIEAGRGLRARLNIKLRQPLRKATVISRYEDVKKVVLKYKDVILDELNVKELNFSSNEEDVLVTVKPVTPILGPKLGETLKDLIRTLANLPRDEIYRIEDSGFFKFNDELIPIDHLIIERKAKNPAESESFGPFTLSLDTSIDSELWQEMVAREVINRIQKTRKELNLNLDDRIECRISTSKKIIGAIESHLEMIKRETLTNQLIIENSKYEEGFTYEVEGESLQILIIKSNKTQASNL